MINEYYGMPSTPTEDYLAHYGVKGMKWGVRKARESGNAKALGRQFRKAQRHLAKLEKRANSGGKYARRAAALGVGAGVAGGLALPGTGNLTNKVAGAYGKAAGKYASHVTNGNAYAQKMATDMARGKAKSLAKKASDWGNSNTIAQQAAGKYGKLAAGKGAAYNTVERDKAMEKIGGITNKSVARAGAAALGLGLAGAAGYNAYRAATTKRAAKKAAAFRSEMQKQFAGTQYANQIGVRNKKRRHR